MEERAFLVDENMLNQMLQYFGKCPCSEVLQMVMVSIEYLVNPGRSLGGWSFRSFECAGGAQVSRRRTSPPEADKF